jgi:hypothetical protein
LQDLDRAGHAKDAVKKVDAATAVLACDFPLRNQMGVQPFDNPNSQEIWMSSISPAQDLGLGIGPKIRLSCHPSRACSGSLTSA